jgi:hypothetical protein
VQDSESMPAEVRETQQMPAWKNIFGAVAALGDKP